MALSLSGEAAQRSKRAWVMTILCSLIAANLIDRQLITILIEPIKREFKVSDSLMGLLTGLSFALVYVSAALPIARWSDRGERRTVIAVCVAVWSSMTMLCGIAQSYLQLALSRMGVAVGEAGYNPSAHSIIADLFPLSRRATAMGIFNGAASLGIGFGLFAGGWLSAHFAWRTVFIIVGAPGLLLALLVRFAMAEPTRGVADGALPGNVLPSLRDTLDWLARMRSFRYLAYSAMTCAFVNYGLSSWAATFFIRVHGMHAKEVGLRLGLASAIGLLLGTTLSGVLADRFGRSDVRWYMRIAGIGMVLTVPFALMSILTHDDTLAFAFYCPTIGLLSTWATPIHTMTQTLAKPQMRGLASAIVSFCLNLLGYGLGPFAVGFLNDRLLSLAGAESIRYSMALVACTCLAAAAVCFSTNRTLGDDLMRARTDFNPTAASLP